MENEAPLKEAENFKDFLVTTQSTDYCKTQNKSKNNFAEFLFNKIEMSENFPFSRQKRKNIDKLKTQRKCFRPEKIEKKKIEKKFEKKFEFLE